MSFEIPKKLTIGGQDVDVRIVERCNDNNLGDCCLAGGYINIATTFNMNGDVSIPQTQQLNTFFHELIHLILDNMGEMN